MINYNTKLIHRPSEYRFRREHCEFCICVVHFWFYVAFILPMYNNNHRLSRYFLIIISWLKIHEGKI